MERMTFQVRRAVHGQLERQRGQSFDLFGGVAGPLRDQLDHGRRKIRIGVHRHALKGIRAGDDEKRHQHQDQEPLPQRELDNVMDHESSAA